MIRTFGTADDDNNLLIVVYFGTGFGGQNDYPLVGASEGRRGSAAAAVPSI